MIDYINNYFSEIKDIINKIELIEIEKAINIIKNIRDLNKRIFIIGVGGSAANASHAVNDFRKLLNIETYAPTDNVAELTAITNDDSFNNIFYNWLKTSKFSKDDCLIILSVGGGSDKASQNIVKALKYSKEINCNNVISIVSRDGGYSKKISNICIHIPVIKHSRITPHAEEWQGIIWHLIVNAILANGDIS